MLESFYNRDPRSPEATPPTSMSSTVSGATRNVIITYEHNRFATDTIVTYERSTDLNTWTAAKPAATTITLIDFETEQVTATFPTNGTQLFIRLCVGRIGP